MSEEDRTSWNQRYRDGFYSNRLNPCRLLAQWVDQFSGKRALDVACGLGRNSRYLAHHGFQVLGVDVSDEALARAQETEHKNHSAITYQIHDLDDELTGIGQFDLVILVRYLNRPFIERVHEYLVPGGHLLLELHYKYIDDDRPLAGPESPEYRLDLGELPKLVSNALVPLFEFDGLVVDPDGQYAALSQLVARKKQ